MTVARVPMEIRSRRPRNRRIVSCAGSLALLAAAAGMRPLVGEPSAGADPAAGARPLAGEHPADGLRAHRPSAAVDPAVEARLSAMADSTAGAHSLAGERPSVTPPNYAVQHWGTDEGLPA